MCFITFVLWLRQRKIYCETRLLQGLRKQYRRRMESVRPVARVTPSMGRCTTRRNERCTLSTDYHRSRLVGQIGRRTVPAQPNQAYRVSVLSVLPASQTALLNRFMPSGKLQDLPWQLERGQMAGSIDRGRVSPIRKAFPHTSDRAKKSPQILRVRCC